MGTTRTITPCAITMKKEACSNRFAGQPRRAVEQGTYLDPPTEQRLL